MIWMLLACEGTPATCSTTETEVPDEQETLGDVETSATELLADLSGAYTLPVFDADGVYTIAELTIARGEGSAVFYDQETVPGTPGLWDPLYNNYTLAISCEDTLVVPLDITLDTVDGRFALAGATTATVRSGYPYEDLVDVVHDVDPAVETVPDAGKLSLYLTFSADLLRSLAVTGPGEGDLLTFYGATR